MENLLTRPRDSSETTDSFFLRFSNKYKHSCLCIFKLLLQQLNDHQALNEISFLITLSMCKGNHLFDLTRDSHTEQIEPPKTWLEFSLLYLGQNIKPYTSYELRAELEKSAEKRSAQFSIGRV